MFRYSVVVVLVVVVMVVVVVVVVVMVVQMVNICTSTYHGSLIGAFPFPPLLGHTKSVQGHSGQDPAANLPL